MNGNTFLKIFFHVYITDVSSSPGNLIILNLNSVIFYPTLMYVWTLLTELYQITSKLEEI